ncbi:MAG: hypothetical protein ACLPTF_04825 [Steroidobacteraceae bacterium]
MKRSEFTDSDFGDYLRNLYDRAAAACGNDHKDEAHPMSAVRAWHAAVSSAPTETDDEGVEGETPIAGGGPGATDSRRWRKASAPVKAALDAAMVSGRSAADALSVAEANLRHQGYSSDDGLFTELRSYHSVATKPRGAAASTRKAVAGYDRLR